MQGMRIGLAPNAAHGAGNIRLPGSHPTPRTGLATSALRQARNSECTPKAIRARLGTARGV